MATRLLQRRIFSIFNPKQSHIPLSNGPSLQRLLSSTAVLNDGIHTQVMLGRRIHTETELTIKANDDEDNGEPPRSDNCNSDDASSVKYTALSNLKSSTRHDLAMIFTCKVCETRSVKTVCRESYEKGVVVARCGGCNNLHLIADRLGWFGEPGSIEDLLGARGEQVKKGNVDTLNLTLEDLAGKGSAE